MKRHVLDPVSLVFGLLLGGMGLAFLTGHINITNEGLRFVWPLPLLALGALLIALGARRATETGNDEEKIPG